MRILISPEFGAFRSGEPKAYRIAKRAMEKGLDTVEEYVVVDDETNKVYVYLENVEDPFVFDWVEV